MNSTESHSCPCGSSTVVGLKQKINRSNNENVEDIDKIGSAGGWSKGTVLTKVTSEGLTEKVTFEQNI